MVDEEYDLENIWDPQDIQEVQNIREDSNNLGLVHEEIVPSVSLEENCNTNVSQISGSVHEIRDEKLNVDQEIVKTKVQFKDDGDCDPIKDSSSWEVPIPPPLHVAHSKKGRRYSEDFKKDVREYFNTHSTKETMAFFDIPKTSVQRWTSVKVKAEDPDIKIEEKLEYQGRQDQANKCQTLVKTRRLSGRKREQLDQKEEILKYKETHTYSDTSSQFGVPVSSIQSWTAKRRESVGISRAVIEGLLDSLAEHTETVSSDHNSFDILKACDLPPAKRISKDPTQTRGPPKQKRKKK